MSISKIEIYFKLGGKTTSKTDQMKKKKKKRVGLCAKLELRKQAVANHFITFGKERKGLYNKRLSFCKAATHFFMPHTPEALNVSKFTSKERGRERERENVGGEGKNRGHRHACKDADPSHGLCFSSS